MKYEFNRSEFMAYMEKEFNGMENCMMRGLIDNIIDYGLESKDNANDYCKWMTRMIPEMTFSEVARYLTISPATTPGEAPEEEVPEITRKTILRAFFSGLINFVVDPNMGSGTVCQIGDHWFYFGGETAEEEDPDEFLENSDLDEVITSIYETLQDFNRCETFKLEYAYYAYYLQEQGC